MKPLQKRLPPEKARQSVSQFVYDDGIEKNIGKQKRTGLYFGNVNPQKNYDGFARYSDYVTYGEVENCETISEDKINNTDQDAQILQISTPNVEIKTKKQQNIDIRKGLLTSRQKPITSPQFGQISSIKEKQKNNFSDRRSSYQQYKQLLEQLGKNNQEFMKKTEEQQQKRLQQQQMRLKKQKLYSKSSPIKKKQLSGKENPVQLQKNQSRKVEEQKRKSVRFSDKQQIKNMLTDSINEQFVFLQNQTLDPIIQDIPKQVPSYIQHLEIEDPQLKNKRTKTYNQFIQQIQEENKERNLEKQKMEIEAIQKLENLHVQSSTIENHGKNKTSKPKKKKKTKYKQKKSKSKQLIKKSPQKYVYKQPKHKRKYTRNVQTLLQQSQSPIQKPSKKVITSISQQFQIVSCVKDNQLDQDKRYPKRYRSKPLQYWKSQKLAYQTGKVIGIIKKKSILDYLGVEKQYQNIFYEQNDTQIVGSFIIPGKIKIYFSGFQDQFVLLKIKKKSGGFKRDFKLTIQQYDQKTDLNDNQYELLPYEKFTLINKSSNNIVVTCTLIKNQKTIDPI